MPQITVILAMISYFIIGSSIASIPLLNNDKKIIYRCAGCFMAVASYLLVGFFHNNGHFLLDIVGWIGIGFLLVFIYNYPAKLKNPFNHSN